MQSTHNREYFAELRRRRSLESAWKQVKNNGLGSSSPDTRRDILAFAANSSTNLKTIADQLRSGRFKFGKGRGVRISRPGKSARPLVIAPVKNRIVQRAILDQLQTIPSLTGLIANGTSFGAIPGENVKSAIQLVRSRIETGATHYLKSDIKDFFTKINKQMVTSQISDHVQEEQFMKLFAAAIKVELLNAASLGDLKDIFPLHEEGVAQGCCLSPLLGNLILQDFDRAFNNRGISCIRYVDDFVMLGTSEQALKKAFERVKCHLSNLGMEVHDLEDVGGKTKVGMVNEPFEFLGVEISNTMVRPGRDSRKRLIARIDELVETSIESMSDAGNLVGHRQSLIETLWLLSRILKGWGNSYSFCFDENLFRNIDIEVDKRISKLLLAYKTARDMISKDAPTNRRRLLGVHALIDSKREEPG